MHHRVWTLAALSCRDDVIFCMYLYQRWIYRVDKTRTNEFGYSLAAEEEAKAKKEAEAADQAAVCRQAWPWGTRDSRPPPPHTPGWDVVLARMQDGDHGAARVSLCANMQVVPNPSCRPRPQAGESSAGGGGGRRRDAAAPAVAEADVAPATAVASKKDK